MDAAGFFVLGVLGLGMIIVLAIVFVIVYVIVEALKDSLRFGYREIPLPQGVDTASLMPRLVEELKTRGIDVHTEYGRHGGVVLDGALVKHRVRPLPGNRIAVWAEVTPLAAALGVVLLFVHIVLALLVGLLAYLQYDNQRRGLRAALEAALGREVYI